MDVPNKAYNNPLNCLRCNSAMQDPVRLPCQHHFCRQCVNSSECTTCSRPFNLAELATDKVLNYIVESSREATETCANCDKVHGKKFLNQCIFVKPVNNLYVLNVEKSPTGFYF
uniref:RING-type domain-containing protein n=1 Tax=Meloidogyne floridensis TaxID=298350 RepID=A0A915NCC0_9BILA